MPAEADAAAGGMELLASQKRANKKDERTKRQRRTEPNPSNTWPQQPKIQSPAARAKAYLRVAGLTATTTTENTKATLDPTADLHSPELRFGRLLGATDARTRHEAVTKLQAYLKARCDIHNEAGGLSELDLMKLWKGLWHTLFLADKVPVQDELSKRLAELIWCVAGTEEEDEYAGQMYLDMCDAEEEEEIDDDDDDDVVMEEIVNTLGEEFDEDSDDDEEDDYEEDDEEENSDENSQDDDQLEHSVDQYSHDDDEDDMNDEDIKHCRGAHLAALFVRTFFRTVQREWGNIDKHRVDKFYTLVRLMLGQVFKYMATRHWNRGIIYLFNDTIRDEVLLKTPNGLRYHLIDITIVELAKVNLQAPMPLTEATFLDCLDPYFAVAQNVDDKMVQARVMENIFAKFLEKHSVIGDIAQKAEKNQGEVDGTELIFHQVHVGTVAQFIFELASDLDTQDRYRKALYDMHKTYVKRLKTVGKDVVLDTESVDDSEEELVPVLEEVHHHGAGKDTSAKLDDHPLKENGTPVSKKNKKKRKAVPVEENAHDQAEKDTEKIHDNDLNDDGKPLSKKEKKRQKAAAVADKAQNHNSENDTPKNMNDHDSKEGSTPLTKKDKQKQKAVPVEGKAHDHKAEKGTPTKLQDHHSKAETTPVTKKAETTPVTKKAKRKGKAVPVEETVNDHTAEKDTPTKLQVHHSTDESTPVTKKAKGKGKAVPVEEKVDDHKAEKGTPQQLDDDRSKGASAPVTGKDIRKRKAENDKSAEGENVPSSKQSDAIPEKEPKKRKRNKKGHKEVESSTPPAKSLSTPPAKSLSTPPAKTSDQALKGQKKQEKVSTTPPSSRGKQKDDEIITISISDQKKATKAAQEKASAGKKAKVVERTKKTVEKASPSPSSAEKRVKFNSVNHSKSHKASMKALVTVVPPSTAAVTPERGILRATLTPRKTPSTTKKSRKKATDYF